MHIRRCILIGTHTCFEMLIIFDDWPYSCLTRLSEVSLTLVKMSFIFTTVHQNVTSPAPGAFSPCFGFASCTFSLQQCFSTMYDILFCQGIHKIIFSWIFLNLFQANYSSYAQLFKTIHFACVTIVFNVSAVQNHGNYLVTYQIQLMQYSGTTGGQLDVCEFTSRSGG